MMNLRTKRRPVPMIPIVSLIDIMVILLIFIIATTTFRAPENAEIKVSLPKSKSMGGEAAKADSRTAITITKEQKIFLAGKPVEADGLAEALTLLKSTKPDTRLELEADTESALGVLVQVWDALRAAGYPINEVPARIQKLEK